MTPDDKLAHFQPGSISRHVSGSRHFVVTANYGSRVTAAATIDITNPEEWTLVDPPRNASEEARLRAALQQIAEGEVPGGQGSRARGQFFYQDKLDNIKQLARRALR